jgi:Thiol-activated cytolysin beta sandwich domain
MEIKPSTKINWTKLIIASLLMCLTFAFGAMAQENVNETLDDEAVSALVEELKEGLPKFIEDEDVVNQITEKWDAREELSGKTRYQIIRLLIEDVRSLVTDHKLSLKIWDKWNGIEVEPEIEAKPEPTRKPQIWIKIVQDGWYNANFDVIWDEPERPNQSWKGHGKTKGWQDTVYLSGEATNIRLKMQNDTGLVWQPQREIFNRVLQPSDLNKCYRVTGTTLGSSYDNDCQ